MKAENKLLEFIKETGYTDSEIANILMDKMLHELGRQRRLLANDWPGSKPMELEGRIEKLEKWAF